MRFGYQIAWLLNLPSYVLHQSHWSKLISFQLVEWIIRDSNWSDGICESHLFCSVLGTKLFLAGLFWRQSRNSCQVCLQISQNQEPKAEKKTRRGIMRDRLNADIMPVGSRGWVKSVSEKRGRKRNNLWSLQHMLIPLSRSLHQRPSIRVLWSSAGLSLSDFPNRSRRLT